MTEDPFERPPEKSPAVRLLILIASVFLAATVALTFAQVVLRFVFSDPRAWVEEVGRYLFVWITFLGGAACVWRKSHLGVDFIRDAMPFHMQRVFRLIAAALMLTFGVCMAWQGGLLASGTWARSIPMLEISEGWRAVPMAISGALITLFALFEIAGLVKHVLTGSAGNAGG